MVKPVIYGLVCMRVSDEDGVDTDGHAGVCFVCIKYSDRTPSPSRQGTARGGSPMTVLYAHYAFGLLAEHFFQEATWPIYMKNSTI